ncbi:MAG: hypothetical protein EOO09_13385 [Chitinophagaceae bacterium]|nr:MAG: hypothetical protein EOO09_13385 [Chitinophagaceae bacterium]
MTSRLFKIVLLLSLFTGFIAIDSIAQTVTGIWRGYFIADDGSQYKLEFQVKQTSTGQVAVSGVSYSYANDKRFYGKATMTGNFMKASQSFRIREIKTVEVKNLSGGGTCIMNYNLTYSKSGKEEFLEGSYLGKPETEKENDYEWGDCGGGKVYLRKVPTSDFYIEPFLRTPAKKTTPPSNINPPVVRKTATPPPSSVKKDPPPSTVKKDPPSAPVKKEVVKTPVKQPPVKKPADPVKTEIVRKADSLAKAPDLTTRAPAKIPSAKPTVLRNRSNELMKQLVVNTRRVEVKLYDNGEVDDDTISVYFDRKLIQSIKRLSTAPVTIQLDLDDDNEDHELVMVAENLGRIPPNTSLMIVEAGEKTFQVRITSNEQKNAVVRFRYEKP